MSETIQPVESPNTFGPKYDAFTTADERKLNAIGYEQEFKRDMSAAG